MDRLTALQVFVEVVDSGSQTAAANKLNISRAMVTRYLAEAERWLGARLLNRSTRRLSLTSEGESLLASCRQMIALEQEMTMLTQHTDQPRGTLRITSSQSFGQTHLAAAIADFVRCYPETQVDLLLLDRTVSLIEERIDLAIRTTNHLDEQLISRLLTTCQSVVCASPSYIAQHGAPTSVADLATHNCLIYAYFGKRTWQFFAKSPPDTLNNSPITVDVSGNISANEVVTLLNITLAGGGIALLPTYLTAAYLQSGQLVSLLTDYTVEPLNLYAAYTSRQYQRPVVRAMIDFLAARFAVMTW